MSDEVKGIRCSSQFVTVHYEAQLDEQKRRPGQEVCLDSSEHMSTPRLANGVDGGHGQQEAPWRFPTRTEKKKKKAALVLQPLVCNCWFVTAAAAKTQNPGRRCESPTTVHTALGPACDPGLSDRPTDRKEQAESWLAAIVFSLPLSAVSYCVRAGSDPPPAGWRQDSSQCTQTNHPAPSAILRQEQKKTLLLLEYI